LDKNEHSHSIFAASIENDPNWGKLFR
jgi:hypothetical protein